MSTLDTKRKGYLSKIDRADHAFGHNEHAGRRRGFLESLEPQLTSQNDLVEKELPPILQPLTAAPLEHLIGAVQPQKNGTKSQDRGVGIPTLHGFLQL